MLDKVGTLIKEKINTKILLRKANIDKKMNVLIKNKISKTLKGIKRTSEFRAKHMKSIIQLDKELNIIKTWNSIKDAGESLNINCGNICLCCQNKIKSAGGYKWKYK